MQAVNEKQGERQHDVWGLPEMQELRQDVGKDIASRRLELGLCAERLGKAASVHPRHVHLAEHGIAFDGAHDAVCAMLEAMERVESIRQGSAKLKVV